MNVILLGPPGVGKGTQGVLLAEGKAWKHIATGDLLRAVSGDALDGLALIGVAVPCVLVHRARSSTPATIGPNALAQEALALMNKRKITSLFVVDPARSGRPVGILHVHDCLRAGLDQA